MRYAKLMVATLGVAMCAPLAMAQDNGGGRDGGRPGRGQGQGQGQRDGGGRPNFEQMRERMAERTKEELKVTDEQWKTLQPAIEKVQQLQMQTRGFGRGMGGPGRGMGGPGGPGGPGPGPDAAPQSNPVSDAHRALQQAIEDQSTTPEVLKTRMEALRTAKANAQAELTKAQADVRKQLNVRQEAVLVSRGLLD